MIMTTRKESAECQNKVDIRKEIDHLGGDRYVKAAAKFKKEKSDIAAPERLKTMFIQRRWTDLKVIHNN